MATAEKRVGHAPISRTFERKRDAENWARDQETDIERGALVSTEADRATLREAPERYLREETPSM